MSFHHCHWFECWPPDVSTICVSMARIKRLDPFLSIISDCGYVEYLQTRKHSSACLKAIVLILPPPLHPLSVYMVWCLEFWHPLGSAHYFVRGGWGDFKMWHVQNWITLHSVSTKAWPTLQMIKWLWLFLLLALVPPCHL